MFSEVLPGLYYKPGNTSESINNTLLYFKQDVLGPDFNAGNFGRDVLGIPGTNDPGSDTSHADRYAGYPEFRFGGTTAGFFSQLGNRDGWNPIFRDERT